MFFISWFLFFISLVFVNRETNMITQSLARTFILESSLKLYHSPPPCVQPFLLDEMKLSYFTSRELDTVLPYLKKIASFLSNFAEHTN